jgi:hypothetical protein
MNSYPTLRIAILQGLMSLKAALEQDQDYLKHPDCPYDGDTVELLERLFTARIVEVIKEVQIAPPPEAKKRGPKSAKRELSDDEMAEVEQEARELLKELRDMGGVKELGVPNLDTATKLQIIKVRSQLLEKLVSIRERITGARKIAQFQATVIGILDDLVGDEGRDEFITRLEPFRS